MVSYILRRLLLLVPTLLGITMLVFFVMALSPGNVSTALVSEGQRNEDRKRMEAYIRARYGLDKPLIQQYLRWLNHISPIGFKDRGTSLNLPALQAKYRDYRTGQGSAGQGSGGQGSAGKGLSPAAALDEIRLKHAHPQEELAIGPDDTLVAEKIRPGTGWPRQWAFGLKPPDLGESFIRRRRVIDVILEALPVTVLLNVLSIPIIYAVAVTAGIRAARRKGKGFDVTSGTVFLALYAMPSMWVGTMLIGFFASRDFLQWFPTGGMHATLVDQMSFLPSWGAGGFQRGWLLDAVWHLVLPVFCLTYGGFAFLSKLMRGAVLENISADFARTARAKGLAENVVLFRHVVRNSILPLITVAASLLPGLLGGSVITESIFSLNGMGRLMLDAIKMKDQELVLSEIAVVATISLVSLLIADICYALADPRVRYE